MSINLSKNKTELLNAYNAVIDASNPINWALFGYEGNSNTMKLLDTGESGLEELTPNFNEGKIMYALVRIMDDKSGLVRFLLIQWQGEAAGVSRLGSCASHVHEVKKFFRGVHAVLNARNEDEVEPDAVLSFVRKCTTAGSISLPSPLTEEPAQPIGSNYKKVNAADDIKQRDHFWEQAAADEKKIGTKPATVQNGSQNGTHKPYSSSTAVASKGQPSHNAGSTAAKPLPRPAHIPISLNTTTPVAYKQPINTTANIKSPVSPVRQPSIPEREQEDDVDRERRTRSDSLRHQRLQEMQEAMGCNAQDARRMWQHRETDNESANITSPVSSGPPVKAKTQRVWPPPAQVEQTVQENSSGANKWDNRKPVTAAPKVNVVQNGTRFSPQPIAQPPTAPSLPDVVTQTYEPLPEPVMNSGVYDSMPSPPPLPKQAPPVSSDEESVPQLRNLLARAVPRHHSESDEEPTTNDNEWDQPPLEDGPSAEELEKLTISAVRHTDHAQGVPDPELGVHGRALWDYTAGDDTEISFEPGDIISHIEQIDPGWWRGKAPNNAIGLFPANYIELL